MKKLAALIALLIGQLPAHASFEWQVVRADYLFPDSMSIIPDEIRPEESCVGPALEFISGTDLGEPVENFGIDVSGSSLLLTNLRNNELGFGTTSDFNGIQISDVDGTIPDITGVTINGASTLACFDAGQISFDANSIKLNFVGCGWQATEILSLDVTFAGPPPPAAPECSLIFDDGFEN